VESELKEFQEGDAIFGVIMGVLLLGRRGCF
jgi:hypothetical protein